MPGPERSARVVIEGVQPEIDGGRFPVKRTVGEEVVVEADVFADGTDVLRAVLLHRREGEREWTETSMEPLVNDRWRASFEVSDLGSYAYTVMAWVSPFGSWQRDLAKKAAAGQEVGVDLLTGADLISEAAQRASPADARLLANWEKAFRSPRGNRKSELETALSKDVLALMEKYLDRGSAASYQKVLQVTVDREKARFGAWYEMFPRSTAPEPGRHGTFEDCEARLPYVAGMGFDIVYLPPVHPIGRTHRKGRNNAREAGPDDPGTPWAIGSEEGGHKAVHPELGTPESFRRFVARAGEHGIEVALDIAFQCSPDHPYVKEHPEWFRRRADGSVQYAENPPKKYEDIYPLNFDSPNWIGLWEEMKSVVSFWIDQGVRIFRVDNPHTKPFEFWEWMIAELKRDCPEAIFLAEAFTRPKIMYRLAKLGFTQSYTYFTWRHSKWELEQYFTELTDTDVHEFFRPNVWTNTPDILTEYLQTGGRPAFSARLVLAATLAASYGIYGPAFELCESRAREPGSEEYLNSEKYEIKHWNIEEGHSLKDFIARVNSIRRDNPALQSDERLEFHAVDNERILCYSKRTRDLSNVVVVVVNLDPHYAQSGWVDLPLAALGIPETQAYEVHDLLSDARYYWNGPRNYVELNPQISPAHVLRVHRSASSEDIQEHPI